MTFKQWIFSIRAENDVYGGQWKFPHILTLCIAIALIVALTLVFRKKSRGARESVVKTLAIVVLVFEVVYRVAHFAKGDVVGVGSALRLIFPSAWSGIACWLLIIAAVGNKKTLWNFSAINGLFCSVVFFIYPTVGFVHKTMLFDDWYAVFTHSILFLSAICTITLSLGDFRYKRETFVDGFLKELIALGCVLVYVAGVTFVSKVAGKVAVDPLYFMPNNGVQAVLGMRYLVYAVLYALGVCVWVNAFYVIPMLWKKLGKGEKQTESVHTAKTGRYVKTKGEQMKKRK